MASLESDTVIASESVEAPSTSLEVEATQDDAAVTEESKDTAVPSEDVKVSDPPARLLETSIFAGEYVEYTPSAVVEDEVRPFDVVMVHGLNKAYGDTWGATHLGNTLHEKYPKSRIITCNYMSDDPRISPFTIDGLRSNAMEILNDLMDYCKRGEMDDDGVRPIVFITHDIGGIIVKLALWIASLNYGKYRNVLDSTRTLIFFGCPHRASTPQSLGDMVANLVYSTSPTRPVRALHSIQSLTSLILEINGYFEVMNLPSLLEVINIFSEETDPSLQIFDKFSSTFGVAFEERIGYAKPHSDLAKTADAEKFYPAIDRILSTYPGKPDDHSMDSMHAFQNLASKGSLVLPPPTTSKRFQWISEHDSFLTWYNSYGTALLYVSGKSRIVEASDQILQSLDDMNIARTKAKDLILTFRFERCNDQCSSVVAMLSALLAQVFRHRQAMTDFLVFEQMQFYRSWTQTELLILFKTVLGHNDHEGILVVISCVDQCDRSFDIFLEDLCRFLALTEHRIKILITKAINPDDKVSEVLPGDYPIIDLESHASDDMDTFILADVKCEIERVIEQDLSFAKDQQIIRNYLKEFGHDRHLLRLMSTYLTYNSGLVDSDLISSTPKNLQDHITRVLDSIPAGEEVWARKALLWILYTFRPLKSWELGTALALEFNQFENSGKDPEDFGYSDVASKLLRLFKGIFVVENHEIKFGHPEIRDFFNTVPSGLWYCLSTLDTKEIVEACMSYFMLPQVQRAISKRYLHQPTEARKTIFPESFGDSYFPGENNYDRFSFCSYAALYLPKHYEDYVSACKKLQLGTLEQEDMTLHDAIKILTPFLADKKALRTWSEAHWWLSNCISRGDRSFMSETLLPIFAGLGLKDLLVISDETDIKDRALALNEAARNGHIDIVRMLLKYDDYDEDVLCAALTAAASCENEELITELVIHAANTIKEDMVVDTVVEKSSEFPETIPEATDKSAENVENSTETSSESSLPEASQSSEENASETSVDEESKESKKKGFPFPPEVLCRAVAFSYENLVKKLLDLGAPVQVSTIQTMTPLDFAVRQRKPSILKLLLDNKAEIGLTRTMAYHPLHLAVIYGMPEMVQQLIDAGIQLNLKNTSDSTATYLGCWHRHYKAVEPIIKAGADLNNDTKGLWTPLTACARRDTRYCAKILLDNNANVEVIGFNDWTPLRSATVQGYVEFSKLLLEFNADPNTKSGAKGAPIICEVARQGNLELVKLLVDNGAIITASDFNASTAVLNAGVCGKTDVVEYLFDHGANVLDEDVTGFNTIALAAYSSFPKTIEMAAKKGVDIHNESKTKWTPIHYAYDDAETTRVLMELGADPNRIAEYYTPLILAATFNKPDTVKVLLKYKPKLEIPYGNPDLNPGLTALAIAVTNGHVDIAKEILDAGGNVNHQSTNRSFPLEYPVRDNNLPMLKLLLEYNPNTGIADQQGNTALHCITGSTSLDIARALVNAGAPLDIINKKGYTPLGEAINEANLIITKYLIEKGSPLNTVGGEVGGPLHLASRNNTFEFITTLVDAGADINCVDPCLGTPLQAACSRWAESGDTEETSAREKILRYFIEDKAVDIHVEGGDYGCALNSICAFSSPEIIKLVLEKEAKVNIPDRMGRQAIHFAASNGMQNFLPIHAAGADIDARDLCGRSVLHWATIGGNVDMIERVLSLNRSLLDEPDEDGWTPLLWACRGAGSAMNRKAPSVQKAVIALLLERGADPLAIAKGGGGDREWSVLSVARYNGGEEAGLMPWLIEEIKKKGKEWDEKAPVHQSGVATVHSPYCDSCLMTVGGFRYRCKTCLNHDYCAKCYQSIKTTHFEGHIFDEEGPEFVAQSEKKEEDEEAKDEDGDGDSSDSSSSSGSSASGSGSGGKKKKKVVASDGVVANGESAGEGSGNGTDAGGGQGRVRDEDSDDSDSDGEEEEEDDDNGGEGPA